MIPCLALETSEPVFRPGTLNKEGSGLHGRGPCNVMPIQSGNDLFSPSPKVQMAIYLGNRSLGQRECADSSRTIGHRIYVDSQETEASVWSLWLSLAHSGSSDPPGSHFPGPYMYNWNRSYSWQDHSVGSLVSGVRDIWNKNGQVASESSPTSWPK